MPCTPSCALCVCRMDDFPSPHYVQPASQTGSASIRAPKPIAVMPGKPEPSRRCSATRSRQNSRCLALQPRALSVACFRHRLKKWREADGNERRTAPRTNCTGANCQSHSWCAPDRSFALRVGLCGSAVDKDPRNPREAARRDLGSFSLAAVVLRHIPSRKGIFKIQEAVDVLKENGWVCLPLRSIRIGSATHLARAEAKKRRACRIHPATGGATASIPRRGLGKTTYWTRPGHTFAPNCPAQLSSARSEQSLQCVRGMMCKKKEFGMACLERFKFHLLRAPSSVLVRPLRGRQVSSTLGFFESARLRLLWAPPVL